MQLLLTSNLIQKKHRMTTNTKLSGFYGHLTEDELKELRDSTVNYIKLVLKGESVASVSIGGKSVTKNLPSLEELKSELNEINNALKAIDPIAYGKKRRRFGFDHRFKRT